MPMGLAGAAFFSGVEEGEESVFVTVVVVVVVAGFPRFDARVRSLQIIFLQEIRLRLPCFGRKDKVVRDDRELVQHEEMRGVLIIGLRDLRDEELWRRIVEGIWFRSRAAVLGFGCARWLFR